MAARRSSPTLRVQSLDVKAAPQRHFSLQRMDVESPVVHVTGKCQVGAHPLNEVVVDDETVSRFHCEVTVGEGGAWVKDVGSSNGTEIDGVRVREAALKDGSVMKLGKVPLRFRLLTDSTPQLLSKRDSFGALLGSSLAMRACYAQLERVAETSRPVLLEGESGTGKSIAAEAVHEASSRAAEPFIAVDLGALSADDLEATLFGRDNPRRLSVFEEVGAGTLFLDEVSELSDAAQARLLPILEKSELRRAGSAAVVKVRARILASTREDLRQLVNAGKFRPELYYRLAVVRVQMPSLRHRLSDLPRLVDAFLTQAGAQEEERARLTAHEFIVRLEQGAWPGNVRELFNHLDRCLVMQAPIEPLESKRRTGRMVGIAASYAESRQAALDRFEKEYVEALLEAHRGKVTDAARAAGMDRVYLHRLMKRHGLRG
jgi:two-component system response regulator GlrR